MTAGLLSAVEVPCHFSFSKFVCCKCDCVCFRIQHAADFYFHFIVGRKFYDGIFRTAEGFYRISISVVCLQCESCVLSFPFYLQRSCKEFWRMVVDCVFCFLYSGFYRITDFGSYVCGLFFGAFFGSVFGLFLDFADTFFYSLAGSFNSF